jgi:hypothetical protein
MQFVRFKQLKAEGIVHDRMALARAIQDRGFPKPIEIGQNTLAWSRHEIDEWLASRPRRTPKTGASKRPAAIVEAV